jgi:hypothetical protein
MFRSLVTAALAALLLGGCAARSISNSGYVDNSYGSYGEVSNPLYGGEIEDLDLFVPANRASDAPAKIADALAQAKPVAAELGQPLLVIQSGALAPDEPMIQALQGHFAVAPFSGIPPRDNQQTNVPGQAAPGSFGERLRLAAAEGGYRTIFVYWGVLETLTHRGITKAVSWVPIVGMMIPDESQDMRIRLKGAIIDFATGRWRMVMPEAIESNALSASITRATSDQDQVAELKQAGYAKLADLIVKEATPTAAK